MDRLRSKEKKKEQKTGGSRDQVDSEPLQLMQNKRYIVSQKTALFGLKYHHEILGLF